MTEIFAAVVAAGGGPTGAVSCPHCLLNSMKLLALLWEKRRENRKEKENSCLDTHLAKIIHHPLLPDVPDVAGDPIFGIGMLFADPPLLFGYMLRWFRPLTRFAASE